MNGCLYDAISSVGERKFLSAIRAELLSELAGEIIEIGPGTGLSFRYYGRHAHVFAIEPNQSMLARAKVRASRSRARIELIEGDDRVLDAWPSERADYAVALLVMCSVANPVRTLRRIHRVLKPEGSLITIEHVRAHDGTARLQDWLTPIWRRIGGGCHLNRVLQPSLKSAGFLDVRLSDLRIPLPMRQMLYGVARKEPQKYADGSY